MTSDKFDKLLTRLYTDPKSPSCYSGVQELFKEARKHTNTIRRRDVEQFLEGQETYTIHKQRRLKFERAKTHAAGFMTHLQADLGDFQLLSRRNHGYNYLLVAVDVLSRRVFVAPVKKKTSVEMKKAFEQIFAQMPAIPKNLFTDRGWEFDASEMKKFFQERGVIKHSAQSKTIKAAMAERMIRTLKSRLYRYFSEKETLNWVDIIQEFANAINNTTCRPIDMRPNDVNFVNAQGVWEHVYGPRKNRNSSKKQRYNLGDVVRIAKQKGVFSKGYLPTFSDKLYDVQRVKRGCPNEYVLYDDEGEKMKTRFYEPELTKTRRETAIHIEKILRKRTLDDGSKQLYVKLRGYKYPSWIHESEIF